MFISISLLCIQYIFLETINFLGLQQYGRYLCFFYTILFLWAIFVKVICFYDLKRSNLSHKSNSLNFKKNMFKTHSLTCSSHYCGTIFIASVVLKNDFYRPSLL